jgi:hypothetical protein
MRFYLLSKRQVLHRQVVPKQKIKTKYIKKRQLIVVKVEGLKKLYQILILIIMILHS